MNALTLIAGPQPLAELASPSMIVAYLGLFALVGVLFVFVNLLIGRVIRPKIPNEEKYEVYECGEPTIGSSFVQFDLRFYVVALLFIIFDVEVAFFFPWATVFGKSTELMDPNMAVVETVEAGDGVGVALTTPAQNRLREMGVANPRPGNITDEQARSLGVVASQEARADAALRGTAKKLAWTSVADIGVFFAVLMVGFAYVWKRGDLDWVRVVSNQRASQVGRATGANVGTEREIVLSV